MPHVSRRTFAAGLAVTAVAPATKASAQTAAAYPIRPVKLVIPYPPGGAADFLARLLGQKMSEGLRQPIVVENKPGAATSLAADTVAKAAPDGYTLLQVVRDMGINPSLMTGLPYDTLKAFAWIGKAAEGPFLLVANPSFPAKSLAALVDVAKAKPGTVTYGTPGIGGLGHINVEAVKQRLGIDLLHVPYKGAGPALAAAVSGEVMLSIAALTGAIPFIREGRLNALVVGSDRRAVQLPDVPTISEAGGGTDTMLPTFFAFAAPAGTPRPIIDQLNSELKRALALPEVADKIAQNGLVSAYCTPEELGDTMAKDVAHFAKLVKSIGIPPQ